MTVLIDGRCVCDSCGTMDQSTDMKLSPGWTRVEKPKGKYAAHPDYMHFCHRCSDWKATAPHAKLHVRHCAYPGHAMKKQCNPERTVVVSPKGARFLVCNEALYLALSQKYKIVPFSRACSICGKVSDQLVSTLWKRFDSELLHPGGICPECRKKEDDEAAAGFSALFG